IGHPERDRDKLRRISPLFHAERISSPLLVLHGANDPRVPKIQSDRMVEAVKRNGGIVEYLVFHDEAHGLRQPANVAKAYTAILDFLDRYL
ncbi:MAG TPA: prolyl oligopeptidase family serine peptidase, partial [Pyrinomonadaceae bacterium]|nr:prolyl oligopeptidase family serine peptidase [Pyrinomonadaceae bacterium]